MALEQRLDPLGKLLEHSPDISNSRYLRDSRGIRGLGG